MTEVNRALAAKRNEIIDKVGKRFDFSPTEFKNLKAGFYAPELHILDFIDAALESQPSAQAALARLQKELTECEALESEYWERHGDLSKEPGEEWTNWITADEIRHRIGGLKFAIRLLTVPQTALAQAKEGPT